jgi:DNA-binding MarR family transcriptional regulator
MARYELLDAVNRRDVSTTADVAAALGIEPHDAARQIADAEQDGLVQRQTDVSASLPEPQEQLVLTPRGRAEWDRLDAERPA